MKVKFSPHALHRIRERNIGRQAIIEAVRSPDKVGISRNQKNRVLIKKIYFHKIFQKDHLLMIVCEREGNALEVITVIDTSKISKYF